ncbi:hypothetical protein [Marinimicrobium sp. ABcell2]|uniref:hypothetical protein n=1 Tax=Marinimicrobium sp. ABcell2 TaxID=3069751 RepID=UPI0027B3330B|nr:hypothetical protein [Marinimicrobium sp. ABcell2]MDQ2076569.1 hypothetical protein [Marinimicrobium sp. ABcell2]
MPRFLTPLVFSCVLLTACGGARQEPFDPSDPEEPEPTPVPVTTLVSGTEPLLLMEFAGKRLEVAVNLDDYYHLIDGYTDQPIDDPDFSRGQVVLYDAGLVDDNICAHKLILRSVEAQTITEGVVEVILEYENYQPQTGPACDDEVIEVRPFEFFYVQSRDEVVFNERIQGVRTGTPGNDDDDDSEEDDLEDDEDFEDDTDFQSLAR